MRYIKTYEQLNKRNVDTNKIYTFVFTTFIGILVGKITIRDYGCLMSGYIISDDENNGKFKAQYIRDNWTHVREATPEEIEEYHLLDNTNKYNL